MPDCAFPVTRCLVCVDGSPDSQPYHLPGPFPANYQQTQQRDEEEELPTSTILSPSLIAFTASCRDCNAPNQNPGSTPTQKRLAGGRGSSRYLAHAAGDCGCGGAVCPPREGQKVPRCA